MKKIFIGLAAVVVLIIGGVVFLAANLNSIAKTVIETAGTSAVGSRVQVGSVDIDLAAGTASILDFSVANPEGFSDQDMLRFGELSVAIDISSLNSDMIRIDRITSRDPFALYEMREGTTNFDAVMARFPETPEATEESAAPPMAIGLIDIQGIQAALESDKLPRTLNVNLGDIVLRDLEGTSDEIASQVMRPLITQISTNAASAVVSATAELLTETLPQGAEAAVRELREQAGSRLEGLGEGATETVNRAGEGLRERVGNLFRRNREEGSEE